MKKVALVTGASRGIGFAIAEKLTADGFEVLRPGRKDLDLADLESVQSFLREKSDLHVDVLVNNAGENIVQPLADVDLSTWMQIQNVNLNSCFLLTQFFGRGMCQRGWGRIVGIASLFSFLTREGRGSYATSKAGLLGLTRTAAIEWASQNVLVNALSPGFVDTELTRQNNSPERIEQIRASIPARRLATSAEIAEVVGFLVSTRNSYITGQNIVVDGGYSLS